MQFLLLKHILVAIDLDDAAHPAILTAAQLAGAAGASLHVACVLTSPDAERDETVHTRTRADVAAVLRRAGVRVDDATIHVLFGDAPLAIRTLADRVHANVVVLGPHRALPSAAHAIGGTALAVVTAAWAPCLIAPAPLRLPLSHVVVPIDLSDTARGALLVGLSWASALRGATRREGGRGEARLTALHVQAAMQTTPPPFVEKELAFVGKAGGTWAGVSVHGETVVSANVPDGIRSFVAHQQPDLLVLGTRGLGLDPVGRLGSVAASLTQSIDVPTLLVPPAVWAAMASATASDALAANP